MKRSIRILSFALAFLLISTFTPWMGLTAAAAELPAADTAVTLVGDIISVAGLGADWAPDNDKALMKEYRDGLYEITLNFASAVDNRQYKVAINRSWAENYGQDGARDGANILISAPSGSKVVFRFNTKTHEISDSINNPDKYKTSATLVGSFGTDGDVTYWNPANAGFDLDYIGGGFYKKTLPMTAGSYQYKVAYGHAWSNGEVGSNVALQVPSDMDVTFLANPVTGVCTDSISNPAITDTISLIGSIRATGASDWDPAITGYEFAPVTGDGKFIYSGFFQAGAYEYKGIENYSWDSGGIPSAGNVSITIPDGGKYVVFVADAVAKRMYDSINNIDEVKAALGLKPAVVTVESPVINANGTVTFSYKDEAATSVSLRGSMNGWGETELIKNPDTGVWSVQLRLGDAAANYEYKFFVNGTDWITDPANTETANGNSLLVFPAYSGRKVVLAGTIQGVLGIPTWDPTSEVSKLTYDGNGNYHIVIPNAPAGRYEYKVAMGAWDPENYGANGVSYGSNMVVIVPSQQDLTFKYNDDSHYTVDSINYKMLDIDIVGTGIPAGTKLTDTLLKGIYNTKVTLDPGTYTDIKAVNLADGTEYPYGTITIDAQKAVNFSFDPVTGMVFSDASNIKVDTAHLYFNSRDIDYKSPYGAATAGSTVTFNLQTGKDIITAKMVLETPNGIENLPLAQNGVFDEASNKWTLNYTFNNMGMYQYYFVVSNGSDVKLYGDDDGFYGPGTSGVFGAVQKYGINIYDGSFKTPEWMKNAVIYQIFPDRFFNGDLNNDYEQTDARGAVDYEFPNNWYSIPENPNIEFQRDANGNVLVDSNGNPLVSPNYAATIGDGQFSNDMYGGDLKGVKDRLDYLEALGINVLYFNPVSQSISNHRYDTTDYRQIDPLLGHLEDFVNLATEAKARGMHIIIDGVFNHVSDDSIYFDRYGKYVEAGKPIGAYQYWSRVYDIMNQGGLAQQEAEAQVTADLASQGIADLHYKDWFLINNVKVPAQVTPILNDPEHYQYEGWWGYDSMPVIQALNGSEYKVTSWADEIIDGPDSNTRYWLRQGSSGWRLDVANEVSDETWRKFRAAVKQEGDNVIVGEIWDNASRYLLGDMYDTVMNYRFRNAVLNFARSAGATGSTAVDAVNAMNQLELIREQYPEEAFESMMNLVDSHDTVRALSSMEGVLDGTATVAGEASANAIAKMKLIPLIQMTYPGAPTIYYGDEAATTGAADPDCRRGFKWGEGSKDMVEWYATLANIRDAYSVLRTGDIVPLTLDADNKKDVMAYTRNDAADHALVVINRKATALSGLQLSAASIPDGTVLTNLLNPAEVYTVANGSVAVNAPAMSGAILVTNYVPVSVDTADLAPAYDPAYIVAEKVRVGGISLDKSEATINVGDSLALNAVITPDNASCKDISWASNNPAVATVDANGTVKALSAGTVEIAAITEDGQFRAVSAVTVKAVPVTGVKIDVRRLTLKVGASQTLTATIQPANATNKDLEWTSSNPAVATVDADGKVTGIKTGVSFITATTEDGSFTSTIPVAVVKIPVKGVVMNKLLLLMNSGKTAKLSPTILPFNASVKDVTWSSSNTDAVKVDQYGNLTAGTVTKITIVKITATTIDGGHNAYCLVTVLPPKK